MNKKIKEKNREYNSNKFNVGAGLVSARAITLISLVITIVILIILASVAIYLGIGNNGIFTKAKQAKEETNKQAATEIINLKITTAQMNKYAEEQRMPTLKELSFNLKEDDEIEYVTETTQIGSTKYEVGENPTSIFTRLKQYPYEFEINASLQLASINGIKVSTANDNQSNMKVLWENPSRTTDFPEQTITWGEENPSEGKKEGAEKYKYNYLMVEYTNILNGAANSTTVSKGENILLMGMDVQGGSDNYIYYREVQYVNDTTLKFSANIVVQLNSSKNNIFENWTNRCIPIRIIGIK